jgi:hypothetical protein
MVTGQIGLRATMRYSRASHTTENPFSDTNDLFQEGVWGGSDRSASFTMKHGGMHWNGGISFRF